MTQKQNSLHKKQSDKKTLFLVAAGSGGHITPALVLGKHWQQENPDGTLLFFGATNKLDQSIIQNHNKELTLIACTLDKTPGKRIWRYPLFLLQLFIAFIKSLYHLHKQKPCKIVSTGGHVAIPVCIAAALLRIPIELHELNVIPGKSISALAPLANKICIAFEQSKKHFNSNYKCVLKKYPLRFINNDKTENKNQIIARINKQILNNNQPLLFDITKKTIFLLGGSQGSVFLNTLLKKWIEKQKDLSQTDLSQLQILHQTGSHDTTDWRSFYTQHNIPAYSFTYNEQIKDLYQLANLVICRSGAGTLFELEFFGKQAIVIPLKAATTLHQINNAKEMAKKHPELFVILDQDAVEQDIELLHKNITRIIHS